MLYSKSTGGFYDPAIHGSNIPSDAIEISNDTYFAFLAAQTLGKVITADADGNPVAVDPNTLMTLAQAQAMQSAAVSSACSCAINAGFASSALGKSHTYPSKDTDQRGLLNAALVAQGQPSSWTASLWCYSGNAWAYVSHTAAQVQQVNADWLAYRQSQQSKYADLLSQINAATTVSAVLAVNW
jgi:hypothetical protein